MKTRSFAWAIAIAAIAPFAFANRAAADSITLDFEGGGISQKIKLDGTTSTVTGGPFDWNVTSVPPNICLDCGSTITTWCVELSQGISSTTTYNLTSITNLPNSTAIKNLFGEGYKNGEPTGTSAAAFQLALWELVFEGSDYSSVTTGGFRYAGTSTSTRDAADSLLSKVIYDTTHGIDAFSQYLSGYSIQLLDNKYKQNQVLLLPPCDPPPSNAVPAPPAALLALFGVMALGGRRAWFRKKAVAA